MKTAEEYRQYAADCRRIANTMKGEDREKLLKMAEIWETQAKQAEREKS